MSSHTSANCPCDQFCFLFYKLAAKIKKIYSGFWFQIKVKLSSYIPLNQHVTSFIRRDKLKYRGLRDKETERIIIIIFRSICNSFLSLICPLRVPFYAGTINSFYSIS